MAINKSDSSSVKPKADLLVCKPEVSKNTSAVRPADTVPFGSDYNFLKLVFENVPAAVAVVDHERKVRFINKGIENIFQVREADVLSQKWGDALNCLHHADDPRSCGFSQSCKHCLVKNAVEDVFQSAQSRHYKEGDFTFIVNNKKRTVDLCITAIKFTFQDKPLVLIMVEDITELKRMQRWLMEINLHLEEKVKEKSAALLEVQKRLLETERLATLGQLSAGLVHEINNPLCGISNYLELINSSQITEEQRKYLSCLVQGVEIIKSITGNLLNLARINKLELAEVDIHALIKEVIAFLQPRLEAENIKIKTVFTEQATPALKIDKNKIKQVLLNIMINAIEAMAGQGQIELKTDLTDTKLLVSIRDNGIGIPADKLPMIFKPFVSGPKKDGKKGTGLGLFMAANIIAAHQGDIKVESKAGVGTTFMIILPIRIETVEK